MAPHFTEPTSTYLEPPSKAPPSLVAPEPGTPINARPKPRYSPRISNTNYHQNTVQAPNRTKQVKEMPAPAVPTNPSAPPRPKVPILTSPS